MFLFHTAHLQTGELIEVQAMGYRPRRGVRDRFGIPLEPDDEGEVVIEHVWNRAGEPIAFAATGDASR